jgi:hypothetical protein
VSDDFEHFLVHDSVELVLDGGSCSGGGFLLPLLPVLRPEGVVKFDEVFEEEPEFSIVLLHEILDFLDRLFIGDEIIQKGISLNSIYDIALLELHDCVLDYVFIDALTHAWLSSLIRLF